VLLEARATTQDVGTGISTASEQERHSLAGVVLANSKRLQEALRSLEEYGKLRSARLGQAIEQLRYRAYTLERAIALGGAARHRLANARLYVLVSARLHRGARTDHRGGGRRRGVFQLREKNLSDRELLDRARPRPPLDAGGGCCSSSTIGPISRAG
jgi:thiamine-phosphate pyrophosphorylase